MLPFSEALFRMSWTALSIVMVPKQPTKAEDTCYYTLKRKEEAITIFITEKQFNEPSTLDASHVTWPQTV